MADIESPLLPWRDDLSSSSSASCCTELTFRFLLGSFLFLYILFMSILSPPSSGATYADDCLPAYSFDTFPLVVSNTSSSSFSRFNATLSVKNPDRLYPIDVTGAVGFPISCRGMQVGFGDMLPVSLPTRGAETVTVRGFVFDDDHDVHEMLMEVRDEEVEFRVAFNATATGWVQTRKIVDFYTVDCRVKVSGLREGANVTASSCHSRLIKK